MRVPFLDLGAAQAEVADELQVAYRTVMASGRYLFGEQLEAFEHEFSAYSGAAQGAGVGSGFDALALGLRALGVVPGDEVLVPTNTAVMTWLAVASIGAHPVGVEPDPQTHTLNPENLEPARTARTRAVVPVHLYGRPAAMDPIMTWAHAHDVRVLADAAQAHGARIGDRGMGTFGHAAAWSFYPSKNLGAFADGGCVTSADPAVVAHVRRLRNYGAESRDDVTEVGINSRLDELQAAFLRVRLTHLDEWNRRRRQTATHYRQALSGLDLVLPPADDAWQSAWHLFVIRVPDRARVQSALWDRGIETLVHYPVPPFAHAAFAGLRIGPGTFPIAERLATEVLSLPVGPHLAAADRHFVAEEVRAVFDQIEAQPAAAGP